MNAINTEIDMTLVQTIDGRMVPVAELKAVFDHICHWNEVNDSEFHWKGMITYETKYMGTELANTIQSALAFYVGGPTQIHIYNDHALGMCVQFVNKGYYANIGA